MARSGKVLLIVGAVAALLCGAPPSASAQDPSPRAGDVVASPDAPETDRQVLARTEQDVRAGGIRNVAAHVEELRALVARAPRFDGAVDQVDVYTGDLSSYLTVSRVLRASWKAKGEPAKKVVWRSEPYWPASLYLGSYFNEVGDFPHALQALDAGLAATPDNAELWGERAVALGQMHRLNEALASYDKGLTFPGQTDRHKALLMRGRGFALTDLNRLDEAEQAYRDSLVLEPGHGGAIHELAYIASIRKGAEPTQAEIKLYEDAKKPQ